MNRNELARKLVDNASKERKNLLKRHQGICDSGLARELQQVCYEVWTSEPQKVSTVAEALRQIYLLTKDEEIKAYAKWTEAIKNLVNGKLENCLEWLDKSENLFKSLGRNHAAATTQTSKLYALALLGRYDEAIDCGLRARDVFLAENDIYSTGKIEHNIGNLFWRRDLYGESEPFLASAHRRFAEIEDQRQLAMVENCQAFVKALRNDFQEAEKIYARALRRAEDNDLIVTQAEIEIGLSNLYLFQGRLDLALKFMESSRGKYDRLQMPHQTANCELEIADIYLELNLLPEALGFYQKTESKFSELGMQAELARSLLNHARCLFLLGENESAGELLEKAQKLYQAEGNRISAAFVKLAGIRLRLGEKDPEGAEDEVEKALEVFREGGNLRYELFGLWLSGEILARKKRIPEAKKILRKTLRRARDQSRQIEYLCLTSLGRLTGDEKFFLEAVNLVENSRAALSSEDFRTSFFSDKILPYNELARTSLSRRRISEAFLWHERSRSRSLLEAMNSSPSDDLENPQMSALRERLNWFYSRINRRTESGLEARRETAELRRQAEKLENEYAELVRRLEMGEDSKNVGARDLDLKKLREELTGTTLIEFADLGGCLKAFVLTERRLKVFAVAADPITLQNEVRQFLFQIKTARSFEKLSSESRRIADRRMTRHGRRLYDILIKPLEGFLAGERLKIIPAGPLNYLPFQALSDGERFLIERFEVGYAPSAAVYQSCLERDCPNFASALLVGVGDEKTPFIKTEVAALDRLFARSCKLLGKKATLENLRKNVGKADVLHLACHGIFRPDNPDFSSLVLFGENLTVKQTRSLPLANKFVALSACETGLNKIISGEELIGLMRGFLSAGVSSLLLSLWMVNDRAALDLMTAFYREAAGGKRIGEALRTAQIEAISAGRHPYFWAPFVLMGK